MAVYKGESDGADALPVEEIFDKNFSQITLKVKQFEYLKVK